MFVDETFIEGSADNIFNYEFAYFNGTRYQFTTIIGIKVFEGGHLTTSAVIGSVGGGTGIYESSVVLEEDKVLICCSDSVFCLSIPDLALLWRTKVDTATCFQIFKYQDSYIVHGELDISRLDRHGEIIWQYGGADVFVTLSGENGFQLTEDYIIVTDFGNRFIRLTIMVLP